MSEEHVLFRKEGMVGILTMNRPEVLNAMSEPMLEGLIRYTQQAIDDPEVRCLVLTGAGRGFCAGGDVKAMASGQGDGVSNAPGLATRAFQLRQRMEISRLLHEGGIPTIAAVNGAAAGAGLSLALACDIRIASDQAKFTTAFARVGFSGDFGGTWFLQRLVGPAKARELYYLAPLLDAREAERIGLVNKVVPHDQFWDEVMAVAKQLAAGPPIALARMKDNFNYGATHSLTETLTREAENHTFCGTTEDHRNAAKAFVEKREPVFHGR